MQTSTNMATTSNDLVRFLPSFTFLPYSVLIAHSLQLVADDKTTISDYDDETGYLPSLPSLRPLYSLLTPNSQNKFHQQPLVLNSRNDFRQWPYLPS